MSPGLPWRLAREQRRMTRPRPCPGGGDVFKLHPSLGNRSQLLAGRSLSAISRELVCADGVQDHHQHVGRRRRTVGAAQEPKQEQRAHSSGAASGVGGRRRTLATKGVNTTVSTMRTG